MAIPKVEGEGFIKEYILIRDELTTSVAFDNLSPQAKQYYGAGLLSFIFKKDRIDALFAANDSNALRIYYGAHENGEPTIVLVTCQIEENPDSATNKLLPDGDRVIQHPDPPTSAGVGLTPFDLGNDPI